MRWNKVDLFKSKCHLRVLHWKFSSRERARITNSTISHILLFWLDGEDRRVFIRFGIMLYRNAVVALVCELVKTSSVTVAPISIDVIGRGRRRLKMNKSHAGGKWCKETSPFNFIAPIVLSRFFRVSVDLQRCLCAGQSHGTCIKFNANVNAAESRPYIRIHHAMHQMRLAKMFLVDCSAENRNTLYEDIKIYLKIHPTPTANELINGKRRGGTGQAKENANKSFSVVAFWLLSNGYE